MYILRHLNIVQVTCFKSKRSDSFYDLQKWKYKWKNKELQDVSVVQKVMYSMNYQLVQDCKEPSELQDVSVVQKVMYSMNYQLVQDCKEQWWPSG